MIAFADDLLISLENENSYGLMDKGKNRIKKVYRWMGINGQEIARQKTEAIVLKGSRYKRERVRFEISDTVIVPVRCMKNLECRVIKKKISPLIKVKVPSTSKQASIKSFTMTKKLQTKTDTALAFFVGTEMMPYNIVEKDGLKKFVQVLNGSYKLPSGNTLSQKLIPNLYNETRRVIEAILKQAKFISCTTDCWTSIPLYRPYMPFCRRNYQLLSVCLGCYEMDDNHTAENLCNNINLILNEWSIEEKANTSFTTDYRSNVLKAMGYGDMGIAHICCFGHAINIAVNKGFENAKVSETIGKIKKIQIIFAHSWKAVRDLKIIQKKYNTKEIPSFSKTRWWSLLNLIKIIVQEEVNLLNFLQTYNNGHYKKLILNADDLKLLNVILELLTPIQNISETLSGENYVTGSTILPISLELGKTLVDETEIDEDIVELKREHT
ncbi:E3 SUMO-protein ligase ZBED1-like [Diorhabda carinulata]|uniref:E3 SUMO-protein ligase ZBED1-like n=1 Tax=Diorhabda carinulata TaxID=1163345 RepID=UPI0025A29517|nr:E3 SUMO-protein ligase ZBED1-like [Diorhabda carinulata]